MNSSAVIFEKLKKMPKIADFAHFESLWSLNANFAGHPNCGKMLGIQSCFTCKSIRWGCSAGSGPYRDFINSPHLVHTPHYTFSCSRKCLLFIFYSWKFFIEPIIPFITLNVSLDKSIKIKMEHNKCIMVHYLCFLSVFRQ